MENKGVRVHSQQVLQATKSALKRRGVSIEEIAKIVLEMQLAYNIGLTIDNSIE